MAKIEVQQKIRKTDKCSGVSSGISDTDNDITTIDLKQINFIFKKLI